MIITFYARCMMNERRFPMIIPTTTEDYLRTKRNISQFFEWLPIRQIIFIGPPTLRGPVEEEASLLSEPEKLRFMDENDLISGEELMDAMRARLSAAGYCMNENSRPGWYYQQFLKMAFHTVCEDEYYMSWDADTIPLRRINMFSQNGKPYLDIKDEYLAGYFRTIQNLFGFGKVIGKSFVSEHMLFRKEFMAEMIEEIMHSPYEGRTFYEKLFFAIDLDNMKRGFSEFETYGSWIAMRHQDAYMLRNWSSMRRAGCFVQCTDLTEEDIAWLSKDFDAATFEGYHKYEPELNELFHNPEYRNKLSPLQFYRAVLESGYFGEYENGVLKKAGGEFPV
ncbi:MAG: DUF6492 family protein [Lachnospiraceae bacterium]|nr:DUF6492 family protein [Lachnospiraceae bacterium]